MSRPSIKKWRKTRHGRSYQTTLFDTWVVDQFGHQKLTAVDFGGWYFTLFGADVQCIESSPISQLYYPDCHVEYDLASSRPDYVTTDRMVIFNHPWFLKYMTFEDFIKFLNAWATSPLLINFNPRIIQHNHLKYQLIDLVRGRVDLTIEQLFPNVWLVRP
jgi:hypothetical protein